MDTIVFTVARGFGSGGKEIASKLAAKLGIPCYENRILTLASQLSGLDEELFTEVNEKIRGKKFSGLLKGLPRSRKPNPMENFTSDDRLFGFQKQIIENLAKSESCVIVGKCADWVLKDYPNVISVYIEAPRAFCLPRIMEQLGVNEETAHVSITKTDIYRADYYAHYTNGNYWTNPVNYDLTLNSARVGIDNCVCVIEEYMKIKYPGFAI
ncbi:MAG: cytidylate kinase-like family protein [Oscillospiraceae bacterium]|jgi:cytidylate kinase|nr:cytidylate kinase-like family protein [Oscillospiraceae bacterium]